MNSSMLCGYISEQKYWEKNKTNELFGEILVKGKLVVNEKIKFIILLNIHAKKLNTIEEKTAKILDEENIIPIKKAENN